MSLHIGGYIAEPSTARYQYVVNLFWVEAHQKCIGIEQTLFCRQAHNIYAYKLHYFLFYIQYSKKKIYFKKRTRPLLHQQLTGGFAKIFFFSAEPPPSRHRTMHIALLLKNNHS